MGVQALQSVGPKSSQQTSKSLNESVKLPVRGKQLQLHSVGCLDQSVIFQSVSCVLKQKNEFLWWHTSEYDK